VTVMAEVPHARLMWRANASYLRFGRCDRCKRVKDGDGNYLLVARQERRKFYLCFECWENRSA
jgi:hypothetical protein